MDASLAAVKPATRAATVPARAERAAQRGSAQRLYVLNRGKTPDATRAHTEILPPVQIGSWFRPGTPTPSTPARRACRPSKPRDRQPCLEGLGPRVGLRKAPKTRYPKMCRSVKTSTAKRVHAPSSGVNRRASYSLSGCGLWAAHALRRGAGVQGARASRASSSAPGVSTRASKSQFWDREIDTKLRKLGRVVAALATLNAGEWARFSGKCAHT